MRRLIPALIPVFIFVLGVGALLFTPADLKTLAASAISTLFFAANVFFYGKSSYFEQSSETRPLLHAWSLGIEEQFYLLIPFIIWLLWRFLNKRYVYALLAIMVASFLTALATMVHSRTAAFYLMPQRAWEFLVGGLVGIVGSRLPAPRALRETVAALGLTGTLYAIFGYSASTTFPGASALLPVVGAGATIWADLHGPTRVGQLLSLPPLVWIGGLSYALYLWHWPILVYAHFLAVDDIPTLGMVGLVALSVAIAWLSTHFIEDWVQKSTSIRKPLKLLVPSAIGVSLLLTAAAWLFLSGGWPSRRPAADWHFTDRATWANPDSDSCFVGTTEAKTARTPEDIRQGRICHMGAPKPHLDYLLWGDSHAEAIRPAFDIAGRRLGLSGAFVGEGGCPPMPGVNDPSRGSDYHCLATNQAVLDLIAREHIGLVVMHSRWVGIFSSEFVIPDGKGHLVHGSDRPAMAGALVRTIRDLEARGVSVVVVGAMPEPGFNVPNAILGPACCTQPARQFYVRRAWQDRAADLNTAVLAPAMREAGIPFADPLLVYCDGLGCPANAGHIPIFYDYRHVSHVGAMRFADAATKLLHVAEVRHGSTPPHR